MMYGATGIALATNYFIHGQSRALVAQVGIQSAYSRLVLGTLYCHRGCSRASPIPECIHGSGAPKALHLPQHHGYCLPRLWDDTLDDCSRTSSLSRLSDISSYGPSDIGPPRSLFVHRSPPPFPESIPLQGWFASNKRCNNCVLLPTRPYMDSANVWHNSNANLRVSLEKLDCLYLHP